MNDFKLRRRMLFQGVVLFKFYVTQKGTKFEFSFEDGMKWSDFVNSKYNDGYFSISGTSIIFKGGRISGESSTGTIVAEKNYTSEVKLYVFESGSRSLSNGLIVSGTSYSKGYSFTNNAIRIGAGEAGKVSIQGINFDGYSILYFDTWANTADEEPSSTFYYIGYGNTKSPTDSSSGKVTKVVPKSRKTVSFDIKNVSGEKYIYLGCNVSGGAYVDVYNIWLE